MQRVILVERLSPGQKSLLYELEELAESLGYEVVGKLTQIRAPDSAYQIGRGKVKELAALVREKNANRVIFFNELKPTQVHNLEKELKVEVIDRFQLILEVFAKRAGSREAKLQIELARLKRELPFIREMLHRAKSGEYPGFMGGGEYAIDTYYKHVVRRIARIERELEKLRKRRNSYWVKRKETGIPTLALVGYTGAGKTTLYRRMTGIQRYSDGKPFATLSTKTSRAEILGRKMLVTDTIGFIDSLPPLLLEAFYTTLGESLYADLLILVVDISEEEEEIARKIKASYDVLAQLGIPSNRIIIAANKIDKITSHKIEQAVSLLKVYSTSVVPISALKSLGLEALYKTILEKLPGLTVVKVKIPLNRIELLKLSSKYLYIHSLRVENHSLILTVEGKAEIASKILRELSSRGAKILPS